MPSDTDPRDGTGRERTRRLFFALWPDEAMQTALADATRAIVSACDGAPVPTQNFHFTLAFLGAVPETRIGELTPIAARVALAFQDASSGGRESPSSVRTETGGDRTRLSRDHRSPPTAPIAITLDHIDHWRKSEVLCVTSRAEPTAAVALAETLKRVLAEHGFAPDLKPFRAHATLARKVRRVSRERDMLPVHWSFHDFRLIESQTAPTGSLYSSREIYPLDTHAR